MNATQENVTMVMTDKDIWLEQAQRLREVTWEITRRVDAAAAALQESPPRTTLTVADLSQMSEHCKYIDKVAGWMEAAK